MPNLRTAALLSAVAVPAAFLFGLSRSLGRAIYAGLTFDADELG